MKATLSHNGQTIAGKTLRAIRKKMRAMLRVDGPRGLDATVDNGAEIHVELYDGQDIIWDKLGRIIFRNDR